MVRGSARLNTAAMAAAFGMLAAGPGVLRVAPEVSTTEPVQPPEPPRSTGYDIHKIGAKTLARMAKAKARQKERG